MGMQAFAGVDAISVRNNIAALNSLKGVTIDDKQMELFNKSAKLAEGSEAMKRFEGQVTNFTVNNVDQSQRTMSNQNTTFQIKDNPRGGESSPNE